MTGEQIPLVTTAKTISAFCVGKERTVILTPDSMEFYDAPLPGPPPMRSQNRSALRC